MGGRGLRRGINRCVEDMQGEGRVVSRLGVGGVCQDGPGRGRERGEADEGGSGGGGDKGLEKGIEVKPGRRKVDSCPWHVVLVQ